MCNTTRIASNVRLIRLPFRNRSHSTNINTAKISPTNPIVKSTDFDAPTSARAIAFPLAKIAAMLVSTPEIERMMPKIATNVTFQGGSPWQEPG